MEKSFLTKSPQETMALAERFAALLRPFDAVLYRGGMGAGKTVFTRGVARHFGAEDEVASPTFALVHEYDTVPPLCHFDLWRVTGEDDLYSIGWYDYLEKPVILLVEWSERAGNELPENPFTVTIEGEGNARTITIKGDERLADFGG